MNIDQVRARLISNIYQSLAQSGIDLSVIPQDNQERFVSSLTDRVLVIIDQLLDDANQEPGIPAKNSSLEEESLWKGRPFLSVVESYEITTERLKIVKGLLGRDVENFELIRLQDIDFSQHLGERMMNLGDITIRGHDPSNPEIVLRNIKDPEKVYEILRRAWLEARKRHGLQFREYM